MKKLFLFFSHKLTQEQIAYSEDILSIKEFVYLPENLQQLWSAVPTDLESLKDYSKPFETFLKEKSNKSDYVLVQGDFGVSFILTNFCLSLDLIPIYSTTKREIIEEEIKNNETIKKTIFKFERFRQYGI